MACSSWLLILCPVFSVHQNLKTLKHTNFFQKPSFFQPSIQQKVMKMQLQSSAPFTSEDDTESSLQDTSKSWSRWMQSPTAISSIRNQKLHYYNRHRHGNCTQSAVSINS